MVFSLQVQRPEEGAGSLRIIEPGAFGPVGARNKYGEQFFKDFLPIGSSMGASHCKDEEWRPDLYLKVAEKGATRMIGQGGLPQTIFCGEELSRRSFDWGRLA